jgi:HPt (histidine-containing phosphotransfer) domain-containing protein
MSANDILDREHFRYMTGGDTAVQAEILDLFRTQAVLWEHLLIPDAPVHTWAETAHTCKGTARGIGLWRLADACERVEQIARGGEIEGPRVTAALLDVRSALREAIDALPEEARLLGAA